ncbi:hypothetical protein GCM10027570_25480 [Streptomonospora sediminis]
MRSPSNRGSHRGSRRAPSKPGRSEQQGTGHGAAPPPGTPDNPAYPQGPGHPEYPAAAGYGPGNASGAGPAGPAGTAPQQAVDGATAAFAAAGPAPGGRGGGKGGNGGKGGKRSGGFPGFGMPDVPLLRSRGAVVGVLAAVVLLLVGGGTAFAMDQRITLNVDGEQQTVHTYGSTVQDVLDSAGVTLSKHDAVAPSPDSEIGRGANILVRSGRELTLNVDGKSKKHWVTALTVGEALNQIGRDPESLKLSVDSDKAIPMSGLEVEGTAARRVVILRDRVRTETATTAQTVEQVLKDHGITLGEHDKVDPKAGTKPEDGMIINVTQIIGEPQTEEVPIEAEVEERENPDLPEGEEKVVKKPKDGVKKVTTAKIMKGGVETEKVIKEKVVKKPVKGITEIGTKPEEPEIDTSGEASSLNWSALAECESGGDPTATNPAGYYGLYQFSMASWESAGGSGNPADASASEQTMRAQKLYDMVNGNWQGQWPECGKHLFD